MSYYDPADTMRHNPTTPLSKETMEEVRNIKLAGQIFYNILADTHQSADMTLAKRKVEEAVMWAVKAVTA